MNSGRRMSAWLEQAWLQRYLARELAADEVEWFEMYVLDKPHLVQAIDADADLRDALHAAASRPASADGAANEPQLGSSLAAANAAPLLQRERPRSGTRARGRNRVGLAVAASLAIGALLGSLLGGLLPRDSGTFMASPTRVVFDTWRGAAAEPQVYAGSPDAGYLLVEVGMPVDAEDVRLYVGHRDHPLAVSSDGFASFLWRREANDGAIPVIEFTSAGERLRLELPLPPLPEGDVR